MRRMRLDERADRLGGHQHHEHGEDDGRDHDPHIVGHPDRGDDRVEREHDVEQHHLDDDAGEGRGHPSRSASVGAFELVVDLVGRLGEQEQAAADQDQVAAGDLLAENAEERRRQPRRSS